MEPAPALAAAPGNLPEAALKAVQDRVRRDPDGFVRRVRGSLDPANDPEMPEEIQRLYRKPGK